MRMTKQQRAALEQYKKEERQYDRYMGSVFVTPIGERTHQAKVSTAYVQCKALGMSHLHGL